MEREKAGLSERYGWLVPLAMLAAVGLGSALALGLSRDAFGPIVGFLFAVPLLWVVISALWPARADRKCPACDRDTLERLDAEATYGISCSSCGFTDESQSSWLLAEEEGPLEEIVLEQRRRKSRSPLDRSIPGD